MSFDTLAWRIIFILISGTSYLYFSRNELFISRFSGIAIASFLITIGKVEWAIAYLCFYTLSLVFRH